MAKKHYRILAISHSCVVKAYRQRHNEVCRKERVHVTLLTPCQWTQFNRLCYAPPKDEDECFELIRQQPSLDWLPSHGLRNASHYYPNIAKLIEKTKPHILELWAEPFSMVAWHAARAFRHFSPQGPILFFSAQNVHKWRPFPWSYFENTIFKEANFCMAMNEDVQRVLKEKGWQGESEVVPLGVHLPLYEQVTAMKCAFPSTAPVVGYLGKMDEQKGVLDLVEALALLDKEVKHNLLFIGNGPLFSTVKSKLNGLNCPHLCLAAISHEKVPQALAAMDIVVMPSRTQKHLKEQFGRVAVEAMASGKAVIVSSSGALPSVVQDCGIVFPEGDVQALASAINTLLQDKNMRQELGQHARQRASDKYSWSVIASQFIDIYRRLLPVSEVD